MFDEMANCSKLLSLLGYFGQQPRLTSLERRLSCFRDWMISGCALLLKVDLIGRANHCSCPLRFLSLVWHEPPNLLKSYLWHLQLVEISIICIVWVHQTAVLPHYDSYEATSPSYILIRDNTSHVSYNLFLPYWQWYTKRCYNLSRCRKMWENVGGDKIISRSKPHQIVRMTPRTETKSF